MENTPKIEYGWKLPQKLKMDGNYPQNIERGKFASQIQQRLSLIYENKVWFSWILWRNWAKILKFRIKFPKKENKNFIFRWFINLLTKVSYHGIKYTRRKRTEMVEIKIRSKPWFQPFSVVYWPRSQFAPDEFPLHKQINPCGFILSSGIPIPDLHGLFRHNFRSHHIPEYLNDR